MLYRVHLNYHTITTMTPPCSYFKYEWAMEGLSRSKVMVTLTFYIDIFLQLYRYEFLFTLRRYMKVHYRFPTA